MYQNMPMLLKTVFSKHRPKMRSGWHARYLDHLDDILHLYEPCWAKHICRLLVRCTLSKYYSWIPELSGKCGSLTLLSPLSSANLVKIS